MIASIFRKSKPINFVVVFFITLLAFFIANIKQLQEPITGALFLEKMADLGLCCLSILTLNFIVVKNNLTKNNNYQILLFSLFFLTLPQILVYEKMLLANFFILLGLRKLIALRSQKSIMKKLFDAGFWITIASFFYFWSILFFVVIMASLLLYTDNKLKHWIIPFMGPTAVFIIGTGISVIMYDDFFKIFNIMPQVSYDFSNYNKIQYLVAITTFISFGLWSSIFYLKGLNNKKKAARPSFKIIFIALMVAFIISVSAPQKNGSEFLFMFAPLAIIITNYIETIEEKWFKELFLFVLTVVPFVLLVL